MIDRFSVYLSRLLVVLPLGSLFLAAMAWLRYGLDLPWFDDWRGYADGTIRSLELGHLFRPINDTMAPVGFALDALAQRYLDGNTVAYQFLSLVTVLGGLLVLQWKLLSRTLDDRLKASICFAFTIFMLQPDSYWGRENLAYHQALPLIFILSAVWVMVCARVAKWWHGPLLLLLGLLAGFTYISGAFGAFTAGATLLVVAFLVYRGEARRRLLGNALWFTAAGALAAVLQYTLAVLPMRGTHAGIPMSLPHEAQFWFFFLGKLARSLLLSPTQPELAMVVTLAVCAAALALAVVVVARARKQGSSEQQQRLAAIYLTVGAVVFVYMMMVAAGRTRFRPPEMVGLMEIFAYAFTRFHFFWATLLWPWVAAALVMMPAWGRRPTSWAWAGVPLLLVLGLLLFDRTGFRHMESQRVLSLERNPISHCLLAEVQKEGPVECLGLIPPRFEVTAPDAYGAYAHAWNIGASFVRHYPVLPAAARSDKVPPFYQMKRLVGKIDLEQMDYDGDYTVHVTGTDPKVLVDTGQPDIMRACQSMAVEVDLRAGLEGVAQLYFQPQGATGFSESDSREARVDAGTVQTLRFRADSQTGFSDPLRFDPVGREQTMQILDIRAYCLAKKKK